MIKEFLHPFKGFGRVESSCLVKMWEDDGEYFICFIDIDSGTSVTNASEQLATEIVNEYKLQPEECKFFETYQQYAYETFDEISYSWNKNKLNGEFVASNPSWTPATLELKKIFTGKWSQEKNPAPIVKEKRKHILIKKK